MSRNEDAVVKDAVWILIALGVATWGAHGIAGWHGVALWWSSILLWRVYSEDGK